MQQYGLSSIMMALFNSGCGLNDAAAFKEHSAEKYYRLVYEAHRLLDVQSALLQLPERVGAPACCTTRSAAPASCGWSHPKG